jgi:hypothetical protein
LIKGDRFLCRNVAAPPDYTAVAAGAGNCMKPMVLPYRPKAPTCDGHQLPAVASRVTSNDRKRNFPREVTMATIRKGSKQFTRWFNSYCEANKPPYRWYEDGTYVA